MTLKEARKLGIRYCEENKCNYAYISYDKGDYSLTDKECADTVFIVNKNGSLDTCLYTNYSADFHDDYKRRETNRRKSGKRKIADMYNYDYEDYEVEE